MALQNELQSLGLNDKEARVYLMLADLGKTTAHMLSKKTSIARASIYFLLEALIEKGLVSSEKKKGTTFFLAAPPLSLVKMVERERDRASQKIRIAEQLVKIIEPYFKNRSYSIPKLQFFDGKAAVQRMLYDNEDFWHQSMLESDNTWWGFEDTTLFLHFQTWFNHIWDKFEKERKAAINVRVFSNIAVPEKVKRSFPRTLLRPLPSKFEFSSTLWLMGNYLLLVVTRQKPIYAVQIQDTVLCENLRVVFQLLWSQ